MQELEQKSSEIFQRNRDLLLLTKHLKEEIARLETNLSHFNQHCRCGISIQQYSATTKINNPSSDA